jgi:hypothetical protein
MLRESIRDFQKQKEEENMEYYNEEFENDTCEEEIEENIDSISSQLFN